MAELNEKLNAEVAEQEVTVADTETTWARCRSEI